MIPQIILITVFIVVLNGALAGLQVWLLERRKPRPKFLGVAVWLWALLMSGLFVLQICEPASWKPFLRHWFYLPMAVEMVWNIFLPLVIFPGMILVVLIVRRLRPAAPGVELTPEGISRRKFLYLLSYGALPATAMGMGVHGALTRHDLRVREFPIPISGLPPELEGFTIAHVSDLHSGIFVGPTRLKIIRDAVNDLKADLLAITGDIINRAMDEFPPALDAMQRMESRHGAYLCEGNHDIIPGPGLVLGACAKNNLPMLSNSCTALHVNGRRLLLGGLPWAAVYDFEGKPEIVRHLFPARREGDVRILLAHHPHLFDIAQEADLVLSGHTHGGQIMVGDIGLGRLRFKYWSGRYQRGATTMIVSNGCGDWFPCRIGAPAEIGLLRLTRA